RRHRLHPPHARIGSRQGFASHPTSRPGNRPRHPPRMPAEASTRVGHASPPASCRWAVTSGIEASSTAPDISGGRVARNEVPSWPSFRGAGGGAREREAIPVVDPLHLALQAELPLVEREVLDYHRRRPEPLLEFAFAVPWL